MDGTKPVRKSTYYYQKRNQEIAKISEKIVEIQENTIVNI